MLGTNIRSQSSGRTNLTSTAPRIVKAKNRRSIVSPLIIQFLAYFAWVIGSSLMLIVWGTGNAHGTEVKKHVSAPGKDIASARGYVRAEISAPAQAEQLSSPTLSILAKSHSYHYVKLSPDGKHIAAIKTREGKRVMVVLSTDDFKPVSEIKLSGNSQTGEMFWVNNKRLVIKVVRPKKGVEELAYYGELYGVNFDGTRGKTIYGHLSHSDIFRDPFSRKPKIRGWATIIDTLPKEERYILIASHPMSENQNHKATVHKLNVYRGTMSRAIATAPHANAHFVTDQKGDLRMVTGLDDDFLNRAYWFLPEEGEWQELPDAKWRNRFHPLAFDETNEWLFVLDNWREDKVGLYKLSSKTGDVRRVYLNDNVDITSVVFDAEQQNVFAVRVDHGVTQYEVLDPKHKEAEMFKKLTATFPDTNVKITSRSLDGQRFVAELSADTMPLRFVYVDNQANHFQPLSDQLTQIDTTQLAKTYPIQFTARDGLAIHGYFTRPNNVSNDHNVPMVTLVHGGPHNIRDYWTYNREVQLLASLGFAVLQVNFRGSSGYGQAFETAGFGHWGDNIQYDIIDGTRWAIARQHIDPDKVCIMGASFGGYSAVQSATIEPDLFKCVVANAGAYDLNLMFEKGDMLKYNWGKTYLAVAIGKDENKRREFSPVHRAHLLKASVLLAHGERDKRVPFEHAELLAQAMKDNGKTFEWFVRERETHGFFSEENREAYFTTVARFLSEHLKDGW